MYNLTVPVTLNNSQSAFSQASRAGKRKKKMSAIATLTFRELSEKMCHCVADGTVSASTLPNLQSALKAFLATSGLSMDSAIGSILRVSYYRNLKRHIELLKSEGRPAAYIANRKSLLGKWSALVNQLDRLDAITNNTRTPLQQALQDILKQADTTPAQLAKVLNINKQTFRRWLNGSQPQQAALPALRRLESFFAMEPNALVALAFEHNYFKLEDKTATTKIGYRDRLAAVCKDPYWLKTISDQLRREWRELLAHKTVKLPLLKRHIRGSWVTTEYITKGKTERTEHFFVNNKFVPTSQVLWSSLISYLGWMCRSEDVGGAGLSVDEVQSLAWLTHKPMIHRFLAWKIERAEGNVHNGALDFVKQVKALTHPNHGYLTQMPSLNAHLPEHARHENWSAACQAAFEWSAEMNRSLSEGGVEKSREPMLPINTFLNSLSR